MRQTKGKYVFSCMRKLDFKKSKVIKLKGKKYLQRERGLVEVETEGQSRARIGGMEIII